MVDLVYFVLALGAGAFLVAAVLAYLLGPSPQAVLVGAAVGLGALVVVGTILAHVGATPDDCDTCRETVGVMMDRLVLFVLLPLNVLAWAAGTAVGWTARTVSKTGRDRSS